jgi:hypothetical protein
MRLLLSFLSSNVLCRWFVAREQSVGNNVGTLATLYIAPVVNEPGEDDGLDDGPLCWGSC